MCLLINKFFTVHKWTKTPNIPASHRGVKGELFFLQCSKVEDGVFNKPPAWFLERTRGWIPRGHSYSPWCAPTSWSGLSPRRAKVKGRKAGGKQGNKRAARGKEEGRNIDTLKSLRGQDCWKMPKDQKKKKKKKRLAASKWMNKIITTEE